MKEKLCEETRETGRNETKFHFKAKRRADAQPIETFAPQTEGYK